MTTFSLKRPRLLEALTSRGARAVDFYFDADAYDRRMPSYRPSVAPREPDPRLPDLTAAHPEWRLDHTFPPNRVVHAIPVADLTAISVDAHRHDA